MPRIGPSLLLAFLPVAAVSPVVGVVAVIGVVWFWADRRLLRVLAADYARDAPMVNQVGLALCVGVLVGAPIEGLYGLALEALIAGLAIVALTRFFERRSRSRDS